ncbi:MAG: DNA-binding LacI/PurR family transcriptional regulator, partial [Halieaceae bacterium]
SVSDATRKKVFRAAQALNYVPNSMARSLITARSNIIAMVVGDLSNPFYSAVLDQFSKELQEQGKHVLVFRVASGSEVDDALIHVLQYQVDGIILTSAQVSSKMAGLCLERGIPVVMFNRYVEGLPTDNVCCDNLKGGRLAAQALLDAGGARFAMIAGEREASTNRDRTRGFMRTLRSAGITAKDVHIAHGHYTYDGGYKAALALFSADGETPDALFCTNDIMALGALDALRYQLGYRVPEDVMVIGFDDIPEAARAPYRLTTIRQPREQMTAKTLELLDAGAKTVAGPTTAYIEGTLVRRETLRE